MNVVPVPTVLEARTVDALLAGVTAVSGGKVLLDARHLRWVDPQGMLALLAVGQVLQDRTGERPALHLPEQGETPGYLARMGFFQAAEGLLSLEGTHPRRAASSSSDVLLEVTPITTNGDIHTLVDRVQTRAGAILSRTLGYPSTAVVQFSVILSEVCQNILEHADAPGWVAAQAYNWTKRLGRHVLVIAVSDLGRGFRGSLGSEHGARFPDRWSDATALEAAFLHGTTRFADSGRGQGIQQIRKQVRRWDGSVSIRSGTARIADVPEWDEAPALEEGLAPFPGAQIHIVLPERADRGA